MILELLVNRILKILPDDALCLLHEECFDEMRNRAFIIYEQELNQDTVSLSAKKSILKSINDDEIYHCDGTLQEFIEAAKSLNYEYDYQETGEGYDFLAWDLDEEEKAAKIKLCKLQN